MSNDIKNTYKQSMCQNCYNDEYVQITDNTESILQQNASTKVEYFTFIYCEKGGIKIELNNIVFHICKNDILICLPNSLIRLTEDMPEHKLLIISFSNRFAHRMTQTEKGTWRVMEHLHNNPVRHLNKSDSSTLKKYIELVSEKIKTATDKFQKDILMYISSAMFSEMIAVAYKNIQEYNEKENTQDSLRQSDYIFNNFMEAVAADKGRHRTIRYYAEMLCYTPKYLSTTIKKVCGKNALSLINDNAIEHIIAELKYSDKNIKQIAFEFNFSNNSFFSKFFKRHTGFSPTEYRNNISKDENLPKEGDKETDF